LKTQLQKINQHLDSQNRNLVDERNKTTQLAADKEQLSRELGDRDREVGRLQRVEDDQAEEIELLNATCGNLREDVEELKKRIHDLLAQHAETVADLKGDRDTRLDLMAQELDQEHRYRQIAEDEIASKAAEYTALQIQYQQTKSDLDDTKKELADMEEAMKQRDVELDTLVVDLRAKNQEKEELEDAVSELEQKAEGLEEDIKSLANQHDDDQHTLKMRAEEVEDAEQQIGILGEQLKTANTEVNKLRADVFGVCIPVPTRSPTWY
jgi:chromosome segregation ATPase